MRGKYYREFQQRILLRPLLWRPLGRVRGLGVAGLILKSRLRSLDTGLLAPRLLLTQASLCVALLSVRLSLTIGARGHIILLAQLPHVVVRVSFTDFPSDQILAQSHSI